MWCECILCYAWEAIDASDVDYFKKPSSNQGVHVVFATNRAFDSFDACFLDALEKVSASSRDKSIGVYVITTPNVAPSPKDATR